VHSLQVRVTERISYSVLTRCGRNEIASALAEVAPEKYAKRNCYRNKETLEKSLPELGYSPYQATYGDAERLANGDHITGPSISTAGAEDGEEYSNTWHAPYGLPEGSCPSKQLVYS
jgi:hypothetical protein